MIAAETPTAEYLRSRTPEPGSRAATQQREEALPVRRSAWPVVLVSMPFMDVFRPSIQLGLLKALAKVHGFTVSTLHANLDFAMRIGVDYYQLLAQHRGHMVGDWLFSLEAFQCEAPDPESLMIDDLAQGLSYLGDPEQGLRNTIARIRHKDIPSYLDDLVDSFPWGEAAVVGFSSTFQQSAASFALARRLKERYPHIVTLFGGANFEAEMGLEIVRAVDCVDFAIIGEADDAFPALLHALADGSDLDNVPGLARRVGGQVRATPAAPPRERLDDLPAPDYMEYFEHAESLGLLLPGERAVWLPLETARGCWWGAKHHCTFCGLNGTTLPYRSKSPQRIIDELAHQARRYRSCRFEAVDNVLDMAYLRQLFPTLVEDDVGYEFFYEVKANLSREELRLLSRAGVTRIQPGIESLSSRILGLMRKGACASQNVNLLRWARYYNIDVAWNILWGFPSETESDYSEQAAIIPHLFHLQPPSSASRIWLERFSPLFAEVKDKRPERSYKYVYPRHMELERVAYFFDYEMEDALPDGSYASIRRAVEDWSNAWLAPKPPALTYWSAPGFVQISDQRRPEHAGVHTFEDTLAHIYLACSNRPTTAVVVQRELGLKLPVDAIQEIFAEFRQRGLMFLDGRFALALALPAIAAR